jgi:DNA (cytosine-5)-methyltransferase 1
LSDLTAISLFAGVGGFDLAFQRAGVKVTAAVEIDKKCRDVLALQFPETKLFDDVKEVTGEQLRATGFIPERGIIAGGFPCQDLSIAGLRRGLDGSRSGLFHEIIRLADELKPQFLILENVGGLLSSQRGKDMGIVITALVERGYGVCWRVLDSQNFGVPQRRRRVFIVASLGDHRKPVEILFERESSFWNLETSKQKRKAVATTTSTSIDEDSSKGIKTAIPIHDKATRFNGKRGDKNDGSGNGLGIGKIGDPMNTLTTNDRHSVFVKTATLLRMRGGKEGGGKGALVSENQSLTIATGNDQTLFLFEGNRVGDPRFHNEVSPSVIARWGTGGNNVPMLAQRQSHSQYVMGDVTSTITTHEQKQFSDLVIEEPKAFDTYNHSVNETSQTLRIGAVGHDHIGTIWKDSIVRRLTPKECERLQGFPDDWTASQADSSRYKMMGNAVTVPVVEWIIERMVKLVVE